MPARFLIDNGGPETGYNDDMGISRAAIVAAILLSLAGCVTTQQVGFIERADVVKVDACP